MNDTSPNNNGAGKGDRPRNCFSKQFKDNYDLIDWGKNKRTPAGQINEKKCQCGNCKGEYCSRK
jgi:hypothetical protein